MDRLRLSRTQLSSSFLDIFIITNKHIEQKVPNATDSYQMRVN